MANKRDVTRTMKGKQFVTFFKISFAMLAASKDKGVVGWPNVACILMLSYGLQHLKSVHSF